MINPIVAPMQAFRSTQDYFEWSDRNCDACAKSRVSENPPDRQCPIEEAIMIGYWNNPDTIMIPGEMARRMGIDLYAPDKAPPLDCPEKLPVSDSTPGPVKPSKKAKKGAAR